MTYSYKICTANDLSFWTLKFLILFVFSSFSNSVFSQSNFTEFKAFDGEIVKTFVDKETKKLTVLLCTERKTIMINGYNTIESKFQLVSENEAIDIPKGESVLWFNSNSLITAKFESNKVHTVLRYDIKEGKLHQIRKLELQVGQFPRHIVCLDDNTGIFVVTDASEGGGERIIHFYASSLKLLDKIEASKDYDYSTVKKNDKEALIARINVKAANQNGKTSFFFFNFKTQKIAKKYTISIEDANMSDFNFDDNHIFISTFLGKKGRLDAILRTNEAVSWSYISDNPLSTLNIIGDKILFREKDLNFTLLESKFGTIFKKTNLANHYSFPRNEKYGQLKVYYYRVQIASLGQDIAFFIPKKDEKAGIFDTLYTLIFSTATAEISSLSIDEKSHYLDCSISNENGITMFWGNKLYNYK